MDKKNYITSKEADLLVGEKWFEDYTEKVLLIEGRATYEPFHAEKRAEEKDDTEFIIFSDDVEIKGTMDLGSYVHSIYYIKGSLKAQKLILGDAILVVDGKVDAVEVLIPQSEGIFQVSGIRPEPDYFDFAEVIESSRMALYSRDENGFSFFIDGYLEGPEVMNEKFYTKEDALQQEDEDGEYDAYEKSFDISDAIKNGVEIFK